MQEQLFTVLPVPQHRRHQVCPHLAQHQQQLPPKPTNKPAKHPINNNHLNPAMLQRLRCIQLSQQRGLAQVPASLAQLPAAHFPCSHSLLLGLYHKPQRAPHLSLQSHRCLSRQACSCSRWFSWVCSLHAALLLPARWLCASLASQVFKGGTSSLSPQKMK